MQIISQQCSTRSTGV